MLQISMIAVSLMRQKTQILNIEKYKKKWLHHDVTIFLLNKFKTKII